MFGLWTPARWRERWPFPLLIGRRIGSYRVDWSVCERFESAALARLVGVTPLPLGVFGKLFYFSYLGLSIGGEVWLASGAGSEIG